VWLLANVLDALADSGEVFGPSTRDGAVFDGGDFDVK
jgi:hypothetical protein